MKRHILTLCSLLTVSTTYAGPIDPMKDFYPTEVKKDDVSYIWNSMQTDLKGDDCYKRAHLWSYDLSKRFGIKTSKVFIHYSDKFNLELDQLGDDDNSGFFGRIGRKLGLKDDIEGLSPRIQSLIKSNVTWDYHLAPVLNVQGRKVVIDRYLELPYDAQFPYTEDEAWELSAKPVSVEEWVEALTVRGELLWQARKQKMLNKIEEHKKDYNKWAQKYSEKPKKKYRKKLNKYLKEINLIKSKMSELDMDKFDEIDIKCKKVTTIAEVDANQEKEWCFYSEAPMYYFHEIDLRLLAYGNKTGFKYQMAVPVSAQTESNFREGRKYIKKRFDKKQLELSQSEIKDKK